MDLHDFRRILDGAEAEIDNYADDLDALNRYVGLEGQGGSSQKAVADALYDRIRSAFASGHSAARSECSDLITDLIREHVVFDFQLDPYLDVLCRLRDALGSEQHNNSEIEGDWVAAIQAARDHLSISSWRVHAPERIYARQFEVAKAARDLKKAGYPIRLEPGLISLEEQAEAALVKEIESLMQMMGGMNVARRIFQAITPLYDASLKRYHLVPRVSMSGGGKPQEPWGYLLQLAVKHLSGSKPYVDTDGNWQRLVALATAYAAVIDVQPYVPAVFGSFDPHGLLKHAQETALFDAMFRFPQLRVSDTARLCAGLLGFLNVDEKTPDGWTLNQALEVIGAIFKCSADVRGLPS
ncbi:hypothetical protein SAMN05421890_4882 [Ensifer adhaerens]|nr:hypothetical protein SAMN05421890_4882 [Ensifer adhaerens]